MVFRMAGWLVILSYWDMTSHTPKCLNGTILFAESIYGPGIFHGVGSAIGMAANIPGYRISLCFRLVH